MSGSDSKKTLSLLSSPIYSAEPDISASSEQIDANTLRISALNLSSTSSGLGHTTECTVKMEPEGEGGRHILVAIDMSENGWKALVFALDHILRQHDVLTVYYVLDPRDLPASCKGNREEYRKDVSIDTRRDLITN